MVTLMTRRRALAVVAAGAMAAGLAVAASPAGAVTEDGQVLAKEVGSAYSPDLLMYGVAPTGKSAVYFYEIKNTGNVQTQYQMSVVPQRGTATWQIFAGTTPVTEAKFYTPPVAPGGVYQFTVHGTPPSGGLTGSTNASLQVEIPDTGTFIAFTDMYLFQQSAFTGTDDPDFFVKNGTQPWVAATNGAEESPAVTPGKSAKFSVRIQNDLTTSNPLRLFFDQSTDGAGCTSADFTAQVKLGSKDITSAVTGNGFPLTLAPGKHVVVTEIVKYNGQGPGCIDWFGFFGDITNRQLALDQVPVAG